MKRLLTMLLSAALLISAFAGCGGEGKESSATSGETAGGSSSNQASTEETDWSSQEPYTVKLLIPGDAKTEDVEEVSAAASKILEEKYNTTLEIMRVGFGSYPDQVNLMLSSGEKLDVLYNNRDIFVSAINNGQIISMEEYLPEYGPDLLEQIPEERWATNLPERGKVRGARQQGSGCELGLLLREGNGRRHRRGLQQHQDRGRPGPSAGGR